jgi:predicted Zn-dependent peptidase
VYRVYKKLAEKRLIVYLKDGKKDCIRLTKKALQWNTDNYPNTDANPTEHGYKSESNTDANPTNKRERNNKRERKKSKSESVDSHTDDLFFKVPGLRDKIGYKQHELLNKACGDKETYQKLRGMYHDGRFSKLMDWLEYKNGIKAAAKTPAEISAMIHKFSEYILDEIEVAYDYSVMNGYRGITLKQLPDDVLSQYQAKKRRSKKALSANEIEKREKLKAMIAFREAKTADAILDAYVELSNRELSEETRDYHRPIIQRMLKDEVFDIASFRRDAPRIFQVHSVWKGLLHLLPNWERGLELANKLEKELGAEQKLRVA